MPQTKGRSNRREGDQPSYFQSYGRNPPIQREQIGCKKEYCFAISSIYRIFFFCFGLVGIIAAGVSQTAPDTYYAFPSYAALRIAYLIIISIALIVQIVIFVMDIINACNVPPFSRWPINKIIMISDCVFFMAIMILSIFMIVNAKYASTNIKIIAPGVSGGIGGQVTPSLYYRADSFYAAGIVGLMMCLLYIEEIVYLLFQFLYEWLGKRDREKAENTARYENY